jgi:hypothetical protein
MNNASGVNESNGRHLQMSINSQTLRDKEDTKQKTKTNKQKTNTNKQTNKQTNKAKDTIYLVT